MAYETIITKREIKGNRDEDAVAYLKVLSRYLSGETEDNHEKTRDIVGVCPSRDPIRGPPDYKSEPLRSKYLIRLKFRVKGYNFTNTVNVPCTFVEFSTSDARTDCWK
jgi:hypothetical protein